MKANKYKETKPAQAQNVKYIKTSVTRKYKKKRYLYCDIKHSRPQRPRPFWSAPRITTSG